MQLSSIISEAYFQSIQQTANSFRQFFSRLLADAAFQRYVAARKGRGPLSEGEMKKELFDYALLCDLAYCFGVADPTDHQRASDVESFALLVLFNPEYAALPYTALDQLDQKYLLGYKDYLLSIKEHWNGVPPAPIRELLQLPHLLGLYDKGLEEEYLTHLYRFVSIVIKGDGTVTRAEEDLLKGLMSHGGGEARGARTAALTHGSLEEAVQELNGLIGLSAVKGEITSLTNFIKIQKEREAAGLRSSSLSYHIVFTGNPGTGKTTVARIVADIYRHLGVLKKGHIVETDRSGLVAEYAGQTAVKVNRLVDSALDGVLFIDEAYAVVGGYQDDYGREAVATLVKRMEDDRDRLVVILAGYKEPMQQFIDSNPGFRSRFNRYIGFPDYTPSELLAIYEAWCTRLDYQLTGDARTELAEIIHDAYTHRDTSFGNGRYVRNLFEKTQERQANRLAGVPSLTRELLTTIEVADIP